MGWFAKGGDEDMKYKQSSTQAAAAAAAGTKSASRKNLSKKDFTVAGVSDQNSVRAVDSSSLMAPADTPRGKTIDAKKEKPEGPIKMVDRPPAEVDQEDDPEEPISASYSKEETAIEEHSHEEISRQHHLNSLFNGHLMKWKYEAEEGSAFVRVPAFFGAISLIATAIIPVVLYPDAWILHTIVMGVCVVIMSFFILVLDGRFLASNPLSARAHLRNVLTRNFNIFRFLWGRGLLYITAGTLNIAQGFTLTLYSGAFMVVMGVLAIAVGVHASRKFAALRNSLADESFLLLVFSNYDGDGDGFLNPNEFGCLLSDLGMELDDRYTLKAFNAIDSNSDRRISFGEFNHWWASGYIERGRRRADEEDSYQRLY